MIFDIAERLAGSDYDGLARVDTQWIHVLHVADGDTVVVDIPHHFVLYLLEVMQVLLDEHLGSKGQGTADDVFQLFDMAGNSGTLAAQCVASTHHNRKPKLRANVDSIFK